MFAVICEMYVVLSYGFKIQITNNMQTISANIILTNLTKLI